MKRINICRVRLFECNSVSPVRQMDMRYLFAYRVRWRRFGDGPAIPDQSGRWLTSGRVAVVPLQGQDLESELRGRDGNHKRA
jgi:hypothetical protein